MSSQATSYSFVQYIFEYPLQKRQLESRHFRAVLTYRFVLIGMGLLLAATILDFLLGEYELANACLFAILVLFGVLYLHYRAYYIAGTSVSIISINIIIFIHDARYGMAAGTYFFYFPLFFFVFSTISFRWKSWFGLHLAFTVLCWVVMELTGHSLFHTTQHSALVLHIVFLFCMITSLLATVLFVYLFLNQTRDKAIVQEREKLKALLDGNAQMIMLINKERKIELFNRRFFEYYRTVYGNTLQVGNHYLDYGNPQNRDIETQGLNEAFEGHASQKDVLVMMGTTPTWMNLNFVPMPNKKGHVAYVVFSVLDISERKNYEKTLSETNAILTKLNRELDHFIYRSSHDMRAPLASVMGLVELFQMENNQTEREAYVTMIGKSVHKLDQLLVDITQYAKNKKLDLRCQPIWFTHLIYELIDGLKFTKNATDIDFQVHIVQPVVFYGDEERIRSVIGNLLSNAVRYRSVGQLSFVSITVEVSETARIAITDNGIGIESEYMPRIFDMFFKASHKSVGSGLGLYIVKETIDTLGGNIAVQSAVGVGTAFNIEIPGIKTRELAENTYIQVPVI